MAENTRSLEREILIHVGPKQVWRAITDAGEIVNWFAIEAESEPGVGGHIALRWNLKDVEPGRCHVLEWDPGTVLRMTWRDPPGGEHELPVEIRLERREGGTLLRLVHSGFLTDESWDDEYEGHGRGWSYELRSLRHYLERYPGRPRRHVLARFPLARDDEWRTIAGPQGLFGHPEPEPVEGERFSLRLPGGSVSPAQLVFGLDGRAFVAACDVLRGGLFRLALEHGPGGPTAWVWAFSWQMSIAELEAVFEPICGAVERRLGVPRLPRWIPDHEPDPS